MVWARDKLTIYDNLFEQPNEKDVTFNYSGKHPEKFYNLLRKQMNDIFNVPVGRIQELSYTWEKHGAAQKYNIVWRVIKEMDVYTYLRFDVNFKGTTENGEGHTVIRLKPRIITEYPQDTLIQQSLPYEIARRFWHNIFYAKQRQVWMQQGRALVAEFQEGMRNYAEELRQHDGS